MPTSALYCDACGSEKLHYEEKLHLYRCESCNVLNELTVDATLEALTDVQTNRVTENASQKVYPSISNIVLKKKVSQQSALASDLESLFSILYVISIVVFLILGTSTYYPIISTAIYLLTFGAVADISTNGPTEDLTFTMVIFMGALIVSGIIGAVVIPFEIFGGVGNFIIGLICGMLTTSIGTTFNPTSKAHQK